MIFTSNDIVIVAKTRRGVPQFYCQWSFWQMALTLRYGPLLGPAVCVGGPGFTLRHEDPMSWPLLFVRFISPSSKVLDYHKSGKPRLCVRYSPSLRQLTCSDKKIRQVNGHWPKNSVIIVRYEAHESHNFVFYPFLWFILRGCIASVLWLPSIWWLLNWNSGGSGPVLMEILSWNLPGCTEEPTNSLEQNPSWAENGSSFS